MPSTVSTQGPLMVNLEWGQRNKCVTALWLGYFSLSNENKLNKIVNMSGMIVGQQQTRSDTAASQEVRKWKAILSDVSQPLFINYQLLHQDEFKRFIFSK